MTRQGSLPAMDQDGQRYAPAQATASGEHSPCLRKSPRKKCAASPVDFLHTSPRSPRLQALCSERLVPQRSRSQPPFLSDDLKISLESLARAVNTTLGKTLPPSCDSPGTHDFPKPASAQQDLCWDAGRESGRSASGTESLTVTSPCAKKNDATHLGMSGVSPVPMYRKCHHRQSVEVSAAGKQQHHDHVEHASDAMICTKNEATHSATSPYACHSPRAGGSRDLKHYSLSHPNSFAKSSATACEPSAGPLRKQICHATSPNASVQCRTNVGSSCTGIMARPQMDAPRVIQMCNSPRAGRGTWK